MIQAPSRYARIIRAVVPFAAICGLGYLFLITFVPAHFGPTAKIPMIKGRGGVEDSLINNIERVFVGEEFQESSQPNPYSEFSEIKKGSIYDNDLVLNAQRNIVVSEESYGYIGDDTGMMHKDKDQDIGIQSNDRNLDTQPHVHAGQEHRVESQEKQPTEKLPKLQKGYQHEQQYMDQTDKHSQLAKDQYILEDGPLLRNQQDQSLSNDGTFENDDDSDEEYLAMDAAQDTNLVNQGTLAEIYEVEKANGVLVILADEEGLQSARETIRQVEDRFNRDRNYPWVVLSPLPFTTRSQNLTKQLSKGAMSFGVVPHEQWRLPKWIDAAKIRNGDYAKMKLGMNKTSLLTRHKWRYMSGFVAQHELLDSYEFFWRIDPGVEIFCDVEEDPMLTLKRSAQKFAWSLSSTVNEAGVTGAWLIIQKIKGLYQNIIPAINNEAFLTKESQEEFAACTYGVENSVARIDFFRSPEYQAYFNFIDREGPIYYEKWNDATVLTIGLSLLVPRKDILFLKQHGWRKDSVAYCPKSCPCNPNLNNLPLHLSCTPFWMGLSTSPEMKRRLECNKQGKCIMYVSKPNVTPQM